MVIPSEPDARASQRTSMVASIPRNGRPGGFLVLVRLPDDVPPNPDVVVPHHVSPHLTHGHRPITRTTHAQSLRDVDRQPGRPGVIRSENAPDDNGRRLSALVGLCPRRSPVPSRPPFVPSHPET